MNVTITITVPVGHPILGVLAGSQGAPATISVPEPQTPATEPAPKRTRAKAATVPAEAPAAEEPAKAAPKPADGFTLEQVKGAVNATLKALGKPGIDTVQTLLRGYKVTRLTELDAKHYGAFIEALNEAQAVVG